MVARPRTARYDRVVRRVGILAVCALLYKAGRDVAADGSEAVEVSTSAK